MRRGESITWYGFFMLQRMHLDAKLLRLQSNVADLAFACGHRRPDSQRKVKLNSTLDCVARQRCDGARVRPNPSYPLPLGHCRDG